MCEEVRSGQVTNGSRQNLRVVVRVDMAGVLRAPGDRKSPALQAVWGAVKNRSAVMA